MCDFQIPKEIILVDDGSEDQSRKILTRLQEENARAKNPLNQIKVFFSRLIRVRERRSRLRSAMSPEIS